MHSSLIWLLSTAFLLSGCGGVDRPSPFETAASCELPLKHANGDSSGIRIDPEASSVSRKFNPCSIQQLLSATMSLCIIHEKIGELSAQLILPNQTILSLELQTAIGGSRCLDDGHLLTLSLPVTSLQNFEALEGNWSVKVHDNNIISNTPMGYLVGWSMQAEGLQ